MPQAYENPVLDGILRGVQLANVIKGTRLREDEAKRRAARDEEDQQYRQQQLQRQQQIDLQSQQAHDLTTRLRLLESAVPLSGEQRGQLQRGEDFSIELAPGFATTPRGRTVDFQNETFFVPDPSERRQVSLAQDLERAEALEEAKRVPLTPQLAERFGVEAGTRLPASLVDDLIRQGAVDPKLQAFTDDDGNVRVFDLRSGEARDLGKVGKSSSDPSQRVSPAEDRARRKEADQAKLESVANNLLNQHGGDAEAAIADIDRQARFDESGFIKQKRLQLTKLLRGLRDRPDETAEVLRGIFGEGAGDAPVISAPRSTGGGGGGSSARASAFLDKFRKR